MKVGIIYSGMEHYNGADYVANFMANATKKLGHEVTKIGSFARAQAQDIPDGLDVVIHSSGARLTPELVDKFKQKSKVFLWTHNDDLTLWWPELINPITKLVDKHFSYTKKQTYGSHVEYLPLAADDTIYSKTNIDKKLDVCMVGCLHDWRRGFHKSIVGKYLHARYNFNLEASGEDVNTWYNQSRVVIAPMQDCDQVVIKENKTVWGCPCRTFDVPASGAFQLQVYREGLSDVYDNAPTIPPIADPVEAAETWEQEINHWLKHPEDRENIANDMYKQTIEKNLYTHRMESMLKFV